MPCARTTAGRSHGTCGPHTSVWSSSSSVTLNHSLLLCTHVSLSLSIRESLATEIRTVASDERRLAQHYVARLRPFKPPVPFWSEGGRSTYLCRSVPAHTVCCLRPECGVGAPERSVLCAGEDSRTTRPSGARSARKRRRPLTTSGAYPRPIALPLALLIWEGYPGAATHKHSHR
jgi:hypothetical protein